jgi:hypothetical protein
MQPAARTMRVHDKNDIRHENQANDSRVLEGDV